MICASVLAAPLGDQKDPGWSFFIRCDALHIRRGRLVIKASMQTLTGEAVMLKLRKKRLNPAEWISALNLVPREFPMATLVFGVLVNFTWLAVVFWFLSYWIAWQ
jgi:hypothetical protein